MKRWKYYSFFTTILILLLFVFLIKNNLKEEKYNYNNEINQVIILESIKLIEQSKISKFSILKRESVGVVVYSDGKCIVLFYSLSENQHYEIFYVFNEKTNYYAEVIDINSDIYKLMENVSYTENVYQK